MASIPRLLPSNPLGIQQGAEVLLQGDVLAFPTETVFGLGALVTQPHAVQAIFRLKGRPSNHPLIIHVAEGVDFSPWAKVDSVWAKALINAFWPGPLTLVVPKGDQLSTQVTGGQDSVGIRCPQHPVAQALLKRLPAPVAAPSANRFGRLSPTCVEHVIDELGNQLQFILNGDASAIGIESTIVSLLSSQPVLLRPGAITVEQLEAVLKCKVLKQSEVQSSEPVRFSGGLAQHYSPNKKLYVCNHNDFKELFKQNQVNQGFFIGWSNSFLSQIPSNAFFIQLADKASAVAEKLYAVLRQADQSYCDYIVIEKPDQSSEWEAVADRLMRASAK